MTKLATLKPRVQTGISPMASTWTNDKRIRGTTLQNIRKAHFAVHPLCVLCLAKNPPVTRVAVELDHILALHLGGKDVAENRQSICSECHIEKSKLERGHAYKPKRTIGADGYPTR